jgi:hypothetical protein
MQTQWSTPANDGLGGAPAGDGPDAVAPAPIDDAGTARGPVDGIEPGTGTDDGLEPDEEEAHRSAVDAVDALLDEVELALARLDDGTYGRCEECGTPIGDARLAESPTVRTCRTCVVGGGGESLPSEPSVAAPGAPGGPTGPIGPVGAYRE